MRGDRPNLERTSPPEGPMRRLAFSWALAALLGAGSGAVAEAQTAGAGGSGTTVRIGHGHVHVNGHHVGSVNMRDPRSLSRTIRTHAPELAGRGARRLFLGGVRLGGPIHHVHVHHVHHVHHHDAHDSGVHGHPHAHHDEHAVDRHEEGSRDPHGERPAEPEKGATPIGRLSLEEEARADSAEREEGPSRATEEASEEAGPCAEVTVHLAARAVHRIRVPLASLGVGAAEEALERLRARLRDGWPLLLQGVGGASLGAPASLVRGIDVEECPGPEAE